MRVSSRARGERSADAAHRHRLRLRRPGRSGGLFPRRGVAVVLALSAVLVGCAATPRGGDPNQAIIDTVARVLPAVVDLEAFATGPAVRILGRERRGTGVVVTDAGHILTASQVVMGAEKLNVTFSDGRRVSARLTALDPESGLAVVHIPPFTGMVVAPIGSSAGLRLGQACVALGSQGGDIRSVTTGVVSAFPPFEGYWEYRLDRVIQTDAAIHPGSSGGPLVDAQGRVVGILSFNQSELAASALCHPGGSRRRREDGRVGPPRAGPEPHGPAVARNVHRVGRRWRRRGGRAARQSGRTRGSPAAGSDPADQRRSGRFSRRLLSGSLEGQGRRSRRTDRAPRGGEPECDGPGGGSTAVLPVPAPGDAA